MPNLTTRLSLKKPLTTETADISVINENMDTLDANIAKKSDFDAHAADTITHVTQADKDAWNAKVDDVLFWLTF